MPVDAEQMRLEYEARRVAEFRAQVLEVLGDGVERSGRQLEAVLRYKGSTVRAWLWGMHEAGLIVARQGPRRAVLYSLASAVGGGDPGVEEGEPFA